MTTGARAPERVAVIGAGMTGLSSAWFLQQHGVDVTVYDRIGVAAGSSWGNAGWLTPSIATPLPEPAVLTYGLRAVLSPTSPVYVPPTADLRLIRFLGQFARNSTSKRWARAMAALIPLNSGALAAFDELDDEIGDARTRPAEPFLVSYADAAARHTLLEEFADIRAAGQDVDFELLTGDEARALEPALSSQISAAIKISGERFIDPSTYVNALAASVVRRGGIVRSGVAVDDIVPTATGGVEVAGEAFDAVVVATGARLNRLVKGFGVRRIVQAGRGYSFTVAMDSVPRGPLYFPAERIACTPAGDRLRVAGMMEFRDVDAPLDARRVEAIRAAVAPLLTGADLDDRHDEWVGSRPCTSDGLPLIGRTRDPRVFVSGGHGMWGITLGPVSGKLLAEQIVSGSTPSALRAVDPLR